MPKYDDANELGKKYGRIDMDRVGLFSEMPYLIGDKYKPVNLIDGVRDMKKSQMLPGVLKTKTGLQDAYFDPEFKRIFEKEGWHPPAGQFDLNARQNAKKNISKQNFLPAGNTKVHSTPGDYFGTFGPKLKALSTAKRPSPKKEKILPNVITAPTITRGPGYTDICLNPFPEYKPSPYDDRKQLKNVKEDKKVVPFLGGGTGGYFDKSAYFNDDIKPTYKKVFEIKFKGTPFIPSSPIKNVGNGFDIWPEHSADRYIDPHKIGKIQSGKNNKKENADVGKFYPQTRNKSFYTVSTMQRKLRSAVNNTNWQTAEPVTFPFPGQ
ncbi:UPF0602 protein C4orf47 homolog [Adelges cooleyi]|uniref:UPF0602 protein C4orf47 homolog n=1 Tax=Adelges cooleyi TaxID=133065 RepID=UPI00217F7477|nr:UPF0602 protein C4orf47 homolog [Adelges cooleyi]